MSNKTNFKQLPHNKKNMQAAVKKQPINTQQDPTKLAEHMLRTYLEEAPARASFSDEEIEHMRKIAGLVMPNSPLQGLGVDHANYRCVLDFLMGGQNPSLFDISILINAFDRCSPKEMDITPATYYELLCINKPIADKWNEIALPAKTDIMQQIREAHDKKIEIVPANSSIRTSTSLSLHKQ